jgi:hypothetical protein
MDSNARSTSWHDAKTNKRGRILDKFLLSNQLNIANKESALTTFESTRGTSNVDLTVADNKIIKLMHTWQCSEQESFSDHRYITFCIEKYRIILQDFNFNGVKFITSEKTNLIKEIKNNIMIGDTLSIDNSLCEILTIEADTEKAVSSLFSSSKQEII